MAQVKKRSEQGRNESKRGKTAGKGFVAPRATRSDKKATGKALGKMAAYAIPGGGAVKAANTINKARKAEAISNIKVLNPYGKTIRELRESAFGGTTKEAISKSARTKARKTRRQERAKNFKATGERARSVIVNKYGEPQAVRGGRGAVTKKSQRIAKKYK